MRALHDLQAFGWFIAYVALGWTMLAAFRTIYIKTTPWDDEADMVNGNVAPAISLVGAKIGFVIPFCVATYVGSGFFDCVLWSLIAAVLQLLWFKGAMWIWQNDPTRKDLAPKVTFNTPIAISLAGGSVCLGLIQAFAMIP